METRCLYCTKLEPIFKTNNVARGGRGGSELNRTLGESPATASLHSATPKRKKVPCSFVFRGGGCFLKWKGHFSFWGSALQVFGQCGGASMRTQFCENYFLGERISQNRDYFVIAFCPRGGGVWGGIRAGFFSDFFADEMEFLFI